MVGLRKKMDDVVFRRNRSRGQLRADLPLLGSPSYGDPLSPDVHYGRPPEGGRPFRGLSRRVGLTAQAEREPPPLLRALARCR